MVLYYILIFIDHRLAFLCAFVRYLLVSVGHCLEAYICGNRARRLFPYFITFLSFYRSSSMDFSYCYARLYKRCNRWTNPKNERKEKKEEENPNNKWLKHSWATPITLFCIILSSFSSIFSFLSYFITNLNRGKEL